jgi:hypothetical protein
MKAVEGREESGMGGGSSGVAGWLSG